MNVFAAIKVKVTHALVQFLATVLHDESDQDLLFVFILSVKHLYLSLESYLIGLLGLSDLLQQLWHAVNGGLVLQNICS